MPQDDYIIKSFQIGTPKVVEKVWGFEQIVINNRQYGYCGKILNLKQGASMSVHLHLKKDEMFHVISGEVHLTILFQAAEKTFLLKSGDSFHIFPGLIHSLTGITDARIAEFSTFDEYHDSYRIKKSVGPDGQ